eukprot:TRINITY_DN20810_c0_g1_i1.p1 TRINITY_DN20810_c0_g1~~TRINITY_DN20810_c0_g1_i1.p1  ORF type:complete len:1022 (+),score=255.27 TRINITY_DN20810_c0_g1_i1:167-3232(+)
MQKAAARALLGPNVKGLSPIPLNAKASGSAVVTPIKKKPSRACGIFRDPAGRVVSPKGMMTSPAEVSTISPAAEAQVFDMAGSDDEENRPPNSNFSEVENVETPDQTKIYESPVDTNSDLGPYSAHSFTPSARDAWPGSAEPPDPWCMEDWDSPGSFLDPRTPVGAARSFNDHCTTREVAESVRTELQADIEGIVQQAMDEIRSWVGAEIAFLRQEIQQTQEDVLTTQGEFEAKKVFEDANANRLRSELDEQKKAVDKLREKMQDIEHRMTEDPAVEEDSELRKLEEQMHEQMRTIKKIQENTEVEKLHVSINDHSRMIKRLQDDMANQVLAPAGQVPQESRSSSTTSDRVREAQMVADERKWRMKIERLEDSLEKNLESVDGLDRKVVQLAERVAVHDVDIQRSTATAHKAEAQLAAAGKERHSLQAAIDRIDSLDAATQTLLEKVKNDASTFQVASQRMTSELDQVREQHRNTNKALDGQINNLEAVRVNVYDIQSELRAGRNAEKSLQSNLERHAENLDALGRRLWDANDCTAKLCSETSDKVLGHGNSIRAMQETFEKFEKKVDAAEDEISELKQNSTLLKADIDSQGKRIGVLASDLVENVSTLASDTSLLKESSKAHGERIETLAAEQSEIITSSVAKLSADIEDVKEKTSGAKDVAQRLENETNKQLEELRSKLCESKREVAETISEKILAHDSDIHRGLLEVQKLNARLTADEQDLLAAKNQLKDHNESIGRLSSKTDSSATQLEVLSSSLKNATDALEKAEVRFNSAEKENAAQSQAFQDQLEQQGDALTILSNQLRTQLRTVRQALGTSISNLGEELNTKLETKVEQSKLDQVANSQDSKVSALATKILELLASEESLDLRLKELHQKLTEAVDNGNSRTTVVANELKKTQEELSGKIDEKASSAEIWRTNEALQTWVDETGNTLRGWMSNSLEHFRVEQKGSLRKYDVWMQNMNAWVEEVRVREQGLSHVILHIVEKGDRQVSKLMEEALKIHVPIPTLQDDSLELSCEQ